MYLSELSLDAKLARNPYEIHRHLWRLFPDMPEDKRSFLYRVFYGRNGEPLRVLMQSFYEPSASVSAKGCIMLRKKVFNPSFKEKERLQFVLCANPTKQLMKERCRVPLIDEEQLIEWLKKKLENAVSLENAEIVEKRNLYFQKGGKAGKIVTTSFSGQIRVNDPINMLTILEQGIGRAKAFGCGLMLVRRV